LGSPRLSENKILEDREKPVLQDRVKNSRRTIEDDQIQLDLARSWCDGAALMAALGATRSGAEMAAAANCAITRFGAKTVKPRRAGCGRLENADLRTRDAKRCKRF